MPTGDKILLSEIDEQTLKDDLVYRAIGDLKRRMILDIVRQQPGITVTEVCGYFPMSRFAIMKHLNILQEAGLLERERSGKQKHLHVNPEPLEMAHNRWLKSFIDKK